MIEECFVRDINAEIIEFLRFEATSLKQERKQGTVPEDTASEMLVLAEIVAFIFENKGDKASSIVKGYAAEAAKLSDKQYQLPENHMKIFCNVAKKELDIAARPKANSNPFRKPKAPGN